MRYFDSATCGQGLDNIQPVVGGDVVDGGRAYLQWGNRGLALPQPIISSLGWFFKSPTPGSALDLLMGSGWFKRVYNTEMLQTLEMQPIINHEEWPYPSSQQNRTL